MSGASLLGGITAYTRYGSVPSIFASFAIAGAMGLSSMRIRDGMDYGYEGAAGMCPGYDTHIWDSVHGEIESAADP